MNLRAQVMLLILAGCGPGSNVEKLGTHSVTVTPGSATTSISKVTDSPGPAAKGYYEFSSGDVRVILNNDELVVNGLTYGKLNPGDSIGVDHGAVAVNGKLLQGRPLTQQELLRLAPVEEIDVQTGGYPVTVRPGDPSTLRADALEEGTVTVGEYVISVKSDSLRINGQHYGALKKGDQIRVDFGRVTVSGEERSPLK